jgi:hypothetical protein
MAAIGVWLDRALFSARIGRQIYQPISGIDLAALCIRHGRGLQSGAWTSPSSNTPDSAV